MIKRTFLEQKTVEEEKSIRYKKNLPVDPPTLALMLYVIPIQENA
jgi:hypothetical protein